MSDSLHIAVVAEGPTDFVVIKAALASMLRGRSFVSTLLQPEDSLAFGKTGTGWGGVYRWCKGAAKRGRGHLRDDRLSLLAHDLLILHLDVDVAGGRYSDANIGTPESTDGTLPCEAACPPPSATTNALRNVLLSWCGECEEPPNTVLCVPSKNTETWVLAALFPEDEAVGKGIECHPDPESRLGVQPKSRRIRKKVKDYKNRSADLEQAWPRLEEGLGEAARFQADVLAIVPSP